jgi:hypothetical protein
LPDTDTTNGRKPVCQAWECWLEHLMQTEDVAPFPYNASLPDMSSIESLREMIGNDQVEMLRRQLRLDQVSGNVFVTAAELGSLSKLEWLFKARMYRAPTRQNALRSHDGLISAIFRSKQFVRPNERKAAMRLCLQNKVGLSTEEEEEGSYFSSLFFWLSTIPEDQWMDWLEMGIEHGATVKGHVSTDVLITHTERPGQFLEWMHHAGFPAPSTRISFIRSERRMTVRMLVDRIWKTNDLNVQSDRADEVLYLAVTRGDWAYAKYVHEQGHTLKDLRSILSFVSCPFGTRAMIQPDDVAQAEVAGAQMIDWLVTTYGDLIRTTWSTYAQDGLVVQRRGVDLADRHTYPPGNKVAHLACDRIWKEFDAIRLYNKTLRKQQAREKRPEKRLLVSRFAGGTDACVTKFRELVAKHERTAQALDEFDAVVCADLKRGIVYEKNKMQVRDSTRKRLVLHVKQARRARENMSKHLHGVQRWLYRLLSTGL